MTRKPSAIEDTWEIKVILKTVWYEGFGVILGFIDGFIARLGFECS